MTCLKGAPIYFPVVLSFTWYTRRTRCHGLPNAYPSGQQWAHRWAHVCRFPKGKRQDVLEKCKLENKTCDSRGLGYLENLFQFLPKLGGSLWTKKRGGKGKTAKDFCSTLNMSVLLCRLLSSFCLLPPCCTGHCLESKFWRPISIRENPNKKFKKLKNRKFNSTTKEFSHAKLDLQTLEGLRQCSNGQTQQFQPVEKWWVLSQTLWITWG